MKARLYSFLTSELGADKLTALRSAPLHSGKGALGKPPGKHRIGGLVNPKAGLDVLENRTSVVSSEIEVKFPNRPTRSFFTI